MWGAESAFWLTPGNWGASSAAISLSLAFTPTSVSGLQPTNRQSGNLTIALNGTAYFQGLQLVTTSKAALATGGVTQLGFCFLHNSDLYNYVSIFADNSGGPEIGRLLPGDVSMIRLAPSATPFVKTATSTAYLELYLVSS
jgi:hypothetical protein